MVCAFTKLPVSMFWIAMVTVKAVFAVAMLSKFFGNVNLAEGMAVVAGIWPIGAGLQDPVLTCAPFVRGWLVVAQKLM